MSSGWLDGFLPSPDARRALTAKTFAVDMLPIILCYYLSAFLVLIPNTFRLRLALLPFTIWAAFRTITTVDLVLTYEDPRYSGFNQGISIGMAIIVTRVIEWTFYMTPPKRFSTITGSDPSKSQSTPRKAESNHDERDFRSIAVDAFDLMCNLRGIGWDWSTARLPPFTRSTESKIRFILAAFVSILGHFLAADVVHYVIQLMSPSTFGSHAGGTIFDPSLTPLLRYSRSTFITLLGGLAIYLSLHAEYDIFACIGIIIFDQHPSQWPPLFYYPWLSTSLVELWGKRWHQAFRSSFTFVGGKPLSLMFGRVGTVFGAFFVSGLVHDLGTWGMGKGTEFWHVVGFFLMMAVGVVWEGFWRAVTGKKVGGMIGWAWTMAWAIGWANLIIDAWFRRGMGASTIFSDERRPTKLFVNLFG